MLFMVLFNKLDKLLAKVREGDKTKKEIAT